MFVMAVVKNMIKMAFSDKSVGYRIRFLREEAGMKKSELARAIGVTPGAIWQIENDRYEGVRGSTLLAIAAVFNANPQWIQTGYGEPYKLPAGTEMREQINAKLDDLSPEHQSAVLAFLEAISKVSTKP